MHLSHTAFGIQKDTGGLFEAPVVRRDWADCLRLLGCGRSFYDEAYELSCEHDCPDACNNTILERQHATVSARLPQEEAASCGKYLLKFVPKFEPRNQVWGLRGSKDCGSEMFSKRV